MAMPHKLDDQLKRRLLRLVMDGATVEEAAPLVGVSSRTVRRVARRDDLFAWRLGLARRVAQRYREAVLADPQAYLYGRLGVELLRLWPDSSDTPSKPDAA